MKTCPKCKELNGEHTTTCFKCGHILPEVAYRKICPKCGLTYSNKIDTCENCHITLSVYNPNVTIESGMGAEKWPYIVGFFIPLIGIILGLIYIAQRREDGKSVLITSLAALFFWTLMLFIFVHTWF